MAGEADAERLVVLLEARIRDFEKAMLKAQGLATTSFGKMRKDSKAASDQLSRDMKQLDSNFARLGSLAGVLKGALAGLATEGLRRAADSYTEFSNRLKVAGVDSSNFAMVQDRLFDAANRSGTAINDVGTLYARAAQSAQGLGASQQQLLQFVDSVTAALKVNGGSAESASGALLQLSQALGAGTVRAEEFNSILEGAPTIAKAVAEGLDQAGGSVAKLRTLILSGQISSKEFFDAFLKGGKSLEATAAGMSVTIGASFTTLTNGFIRFVGALDQATGASAMVAGAIQSLGSGLNWLASNQEAAAYTLTLLGAALAAVFGPALISTIAAAGTWIGVQFATSVGAATKAVAALNLAILKNPIAAAIVAVAALVTWFVGLDNMIKAVIQTFAFFAKAWYGLRGDAEGVKWAENLTINADKAVQDIKQATADMAAKITGAHAAGGTDAANKVREAHGQGGRDAADKIGNAMTMSADQAAATYAALNGQAVQALGQVLVDGGKYLYNQATGAITLASEQGAGTMGTAIDAAGKAAGSSISSSMTSAGDSVGRTFYDALLTAGGEVGQMLREQLEAQIAVLIQTAYKLQAEAYALRVQADAAMKEAQAAAKQAETERRYASRGSSSGSGYGAFTDSGSTVSSWDATSVGSFAKGGSFTVGGPSGRDKVPVRFMATRGERVDITPANDAGKQQAPVIKNVVVFDLASVPDAMSTARGEQAQMTFVRANRDQIKAILGVR